MAFLTADRTYDANGVEVKVKILPAGRRPGKKLNTPENKPTWITIHNTDDIDEAAGTNDAEQYARATFNGNMGDVYVHYYIDETECWQILPLDEIGYHATDYTNKNGGNWTSIAIEIVEKNGKTDDDKKAEERGAKLAAWLLHEYGMGVEKLKTHRDWYPKKYCPAYILPHWDAFVKQVQAELDKLNGLTGTPTGPEKHYRVQVGYYSKRENAELMRDRLYAAGFPAIIREE